MPPRSNNYGGPSLSHSFLERLGLSSQVKPGGKNGPRRGPPLNRKEQRKLGRVEKRQQRPYHSLKQRSRQEEPDESEDQSVDEDGNQSDQDLGRTPVQQHVQSEASTVATVREPKSILKKPNSRPVYEHADSSKRPHKIEETPRPRRMKGKLAEDEADIAALEKKLGIKGNKSKARQDDGLDDLLGDLGSDEEAGLGKRKRREDKAWLERKRRKADDIGSGDDGVSLLDDEEEDLSGSDDIPDGLEGLGGGFADEMHASDDTASVHEEENGFDAMESDVDFGADEEVDETKPRENLRTKRVRENPYVAPVTNNTLPTTKYIPPSLRAASGSDAEQMVKLKRQAQGLLNRLSEANLISILNEFEALYQNNARQYVTSTLIDLLLGLICDRATLLDTFLILHAGFAAALYKIISQDFGAQLLEEIVNRFDSSYHKAVTTDSAGKETLNLISLLSQLYNLQVIGCELIFGYVRTFLGTLNETHTELLLRVVRSSGFQLRQDDPSSLKDIVILLHKTVASQGEQTLSVRTKFMIETINDLKNNKLKAGVALSATTSEHLSRMRKILGSMNARTIRASEPLHISLGDIRNTEKRGKWWLVGASWKGKEDKVTKTPDEQQDAAANTASNSNFREDDNTAAGEDVSTDLLTLARNARMNTDIRRAIFITLMSASDYKDAHLRLIKLNLTRSQEIEIPRVLLHCAGAEQVYNPYYTVIARRLCAEHKLRVSFRFALWDLFKKMGEKGEGDEDGSGLDEDEDDETEALGTANIVNLAKFFGDLIANGCLDVKVLKNLDFVYLQPRTKVFAEILFITVLLLCGKRGDPANNSNAHHGSAKPSLTLSALFEPAIDMPHLAAGLRYFLRKVVAKSDLAKVGKERQRVKDACGEAVRLLAGARAAAPTG